MSFEGFSLILSLHQQGSDHFHPCFNLKATFKNSFLLDAVCPATQRLCELINAYPPSSAYLCPKAKMSEALPLPSQTTTGTGGVSLRYSNTMEMTLGPPSTMRATTGTPWPMPASRSKRGREGESKEKMLKKKGAWGKTRSILRFTLANSYTFAQGSCRII